VLVMFVRGALAVAGAAMAALAGAVALPRASAIGRRWIAAARVSDLTPGTPTAIVIAPSIADGWYRTRKPRVIFLTLDDEEQVRALSATCTHLGCRVAWNGAADRFECPCHRGAYDRDGRVIAGPPPAPLPALAVRVDLSRDEVHVEI
jgi:succinate dehydrogenase / fumarate reductase iron-sulfur subunit